MSDAILEQFAITDAETARLYERAKTQQWDAASDIDWTQDLGWPARDQPEVARARRRQLVSQLFYGDQAALATCGQVIPLVPDVAVRLCLGAQARDEARHVEALGRYLNLVGGPVPLGPHQKSLFQSLLATANMEEKLVGVHVLLEGLALDACRALVKAAPGGLLGQILGRIAQDEERHLDLALTFLRRHLAAVTLKRRRDVERALGSYASDLVSSLRWRSPELSASPEGTLISGDELRRNLAERIGTLGLHLPA